ncbi:MAG: branched-chain amino acid ABC transporter permease [Kiloniellales bacterium]
MDILLSGQLLLATLVLGSVYALVAMGLNLIYGTMRLLNVAHGELVMIGAYVAFWAFTWANISPLISLFAAMALTAGLGWATYRFLVRGMLASGQVMQRIEANSLLIFFGLSIILQNLVSLAFTANERAYAYLDQVVRFGDISIGADRLVILAISLAVSLAAILFFRYSMTGLAMRALIEQREAAALVGIERDRVSQLVFVLGFALAGLAGALISMTEQISPFSGFPFTIAAFVVIILGGLGNLYGGLIGAFLLAAIEVYGVALTSSAYRSILVYGVFIAVLLWRPQGLLGGKRLS